MPLPSGLRVAGERLSALGIAGDSTPHAIVHNSRPRDGFEEVDALGRNAELLTRSGWHPNGGGYGIPMNEEFRSALDARERLNDLREIGVYK